MKTAILLTAALIGLLAFAAPASAETVCTPGNEACADVTTVGDPTTGSFGVRVTAGPVNLCIVVFATCP